MNANIALQGFGNVVTRQIGLGDAQKFLSVNAPDLNDYINLGASRVFHQQKEEISHVHFDGFEEIEVDTLDALWSRGNLKCAGRGRERQPVNILKIDSEGVEQDVVEGGKEMIRTDWPLIYAESQPYFAEGDTRFLDFMREEMEYNCSPVKGLEMHEILLCVPFARAGDWNARLLADFSGDGFS